MLTCSYVAVLSYILIKSNYHISSVAVPSLGLEHVMGAHHPTFSSLPGIPGVQEALRGHTMEIHAAVATETKSHSTKNIPLTVRLEVRQGKFT